MKFDRILACFGLVYCVFVQWLSVFMGGDVSNNTLLGVMFFLIAYNARPREERITKSMFNRQIFTMTCFNTFSNIILNTESKCLNLDQAQHKLDTINAMSKTIVDRYNELHDSKN